MTSSSAARAAALLGALAILAIPIGVVVADVSASIGLLEALYYAVPAAAVLAVLALIAGRRARFARARSITGRGAGPVRTGRFLAWLGAWVAFVGVVTLGVYLGLRLAQG
ncbi:MAG TPA: hypothetical protein VFA05_03995 [Gaiellaceae bacterium]|nr:hypothetical protein [Gaiellaceae bacterium]